MLAAEVANACLLYCRTQPAQHLPFWGLPEASEKCSNSSQNSPPFSSWLSSYSPCCPLWSVALAPLSVEVPLLFRSISPSAVPWILSHESHCQEFQLHISSWNICFFLSLSSPLPKSLLSEFPDSVMAMNIFPGTLETANCLLVPPLFPPRLIG